MPEGNLETGREDLGEVREFGLMFFINSKFSYSRLYFVIFCPINSPILTGYVFF